MLKYIKRAFIWPTFFFAGLPFSLVGFLWGMVAEEAFEDGANKGYKFQKKLVKLYE